VINEKESGKFGNLQSVNLVAFLEEKFSKVRTILTSDTCSRQARVYSVRWNSENKCVAASTLPFFPTLSPLLQKGMLAYQ